MGVYLSEPVKEKISSDDEYGFVSFGASSMQGWRASQEDAHNCIVNYDKNTSFFAVYDGHGGAEVAQYCSQHLPNFIKEMSHYKNGDLTKALENGFLEFDMTLIKPEVVSILKEMAGVTEASDSGDENEAAALQEEADMPLEDLLARYQSADAPNKLPPHLRTEEDKPRSPYLRAKAYHTNGNDEFTNSTSLDDATKDVEKKEEKLSAGGDNSTGEKSDAKAVNGTSACDSLSENSAVKAESSGPHGNESTKQDGDTVAAANSSKPEGESAAAENCVEGSSSLSSAQPDCSPKASESGECSSPSSSKLKEGTVNHILKSRLLKSDRLDLSSDDDDDDADSEDEDDYSGEKDDEDDDEEEDDEEEDSEEDEEEDSEDDDDDDVSGVPFVEQEMPGKDSGCTAVVAVLQGNKLYVANAGDSRCVVSREGAAVEMSFDHKPEDEPEKLRITKAGGEVTSDGRVNGGLNLSRAIGDHSYKDNADLPPQEQMITALPDIKTLEITPTKDEFMVLACDGIWNSMTSQEVVDFVRARINKEGIKLSSICEELFDHCLAPNTLGDGSGCDNMTCIVVKFHGSDGITRQSTREKRALPDDDEAKDQEEPAAKKSRKQEDKEEGAEEPPGT